MVRLEGFMINVHVELTNNSARENLQVILEPQFMHLRYLLKKVIGPLQASYRRISFAGVMLCSFQ